MDYIDQNEEKAQTMAENIFCTICGAQLDLKARFCPECGSPVLSKPPYVAESQPDSPSVFKPAPPERPVAYTPPVSVTGEKFCMQCGARILAKAEICPKCGVRQYIPPTRYTKDRVTAGILAILLGSFGIHKFYLGKVGQGILYLLFFWTAIPGIIGLIEGIIYLTKTDEEFQALYVR